jgi:A/G-specific adenine glycosylase
MRQRIGHLDAQPPRHAVLIAEPRGSLSGMNVSDQSLDHLRERLLRRYSLNGRGLPWRHTQDPYAILVSEVMLQQTQVPRVVPKHAAFMERFPDLESLAAAELAHVLALWSGLGPYTARAVLVTALTADGLVCRAGDTVRPTS